MRIEQLKGLLADDNAKSLNPYSNGMRIELTLRVTPPVKRRLNPYSNGMRIEHCYQ